MGRKKPIITPQQAAQLIKDDTTLVISGAGGGICEPTSLITALADYHRETGKPSNLTLMHSGGIGDRAERGLCPLAQPGLFKRVIGGHWDQSPRMAKMAQNNEFEAYNLPMGCMCKMFRSAGAREPGVYSKVGLGTFIDPRQRGGKLNECTKEDLVELVERDGEDWLFYKSVLPDICFIRASTADTEGYLSQEDDLFMDIFEIALATHNNGGIVIAQVSRVVKAGSILPKLARVPGYLVDYIVVDDQIGQVYDTPYNRFFSGDYVANFEESAPLPLTERKSIARRALLEAHPGYVGNLGVGVCDAIGTIAAEEGVLDDLTLTIEMGPIGGVTLIGTAFGTCYNMNSMIPMPAQFDFYDGGGLDICYLSFAEFDQEGNVNVTRFGGKIIGTGGFVNISQNTKKVIFAGTLTAGGIKVQVDDGKVNIVQEGRHLKAVKQVEEISFNGPLARKNGQEVYYITERAVFKLGETGVELIEYAPGISVEKDILPYLDFVPAISPNLREMDSRIFVDAPMGIFDEWEAYKKQHYAK